ncbi:type II toxin-antitoxin system RelE/ParE family toxin [Tianweitania sp. Rool2]|uniref:Type II toxin-antitoxin system RelE/ParE family toxin n=2 Tax=Oryzicola mucosus TaxID=2767425 RepID=A0A8J6U192_9HYPH|nr:type II toxin-antitoxin system RelE/ParE family toxin [Oryzicola mucosus]MBD0416681.1 type II toxin-antitoxin system RelE/ParE family toxin [Oryzicola mucosus]
MRQIHYSREALKPLTRMPTNTASLIRNKIEQYALDPVSQANNVKRLKGYEGYMRLRVGDWRVIFREDGTVVAIISVGPRGSIYG